MGDFPINERKWKRFVFGKTILNCFWENGLRFWEPLGRTFWNSPIWENGSDSVCEHVPIRENDCFLFGYHVSGDFPIRERQVMHASGHKNVLLKIDIYRKKWQGQLSGGEAVLFACHKEKNLSLTQRIDDLRGRIDRLHTLNAEREQEIQKQREQIKDLDRVRAVLGERTVDQAVWKAVQEEKDRELQRKVPKKRYLLDVR